MELKDILVEYNIDDGFIVPFGNGLINSTWIIEKPGEKYILQKINENVFKVPADIAYNTRLISDHIQQFHPEYLFTNPLQTRSGNDLLKTDGGYFRLFRFIDNSQTIDVVETPQQAYEAAKQFGRFTQVLSGLDPMKLKMTLPDFHDLTLRYKQF